MSESVRLLLSIAAAKDMEVSRLDVKTAFLYGLIPAGLTDADMSKNFISKKYAHRYTITEMFIRSTARAGHIPGAH